MSSEGFQLSHTIGGGKALCMTIGSLTPVKLAVGRTGEDGERGCPHLPQTRESVCVGYICTLQSVCKTVSLLNLHARVHADRKLELLLLLNVHKMNICFDLFVQI